MGGRSGTLRVPHKADRLRLQARQYIEPVMALRRVMACCEACGAWPAETVCAACRARFDDRGSGVIARCACCALPLPAQPHPHHAAAHDTCLACRLQPPPLQACLAALPYAYPWDGLIARLKFGAEPGLARPLARLMAAQPAITSAIAHADLVIALPLSAPRLHARGYNQALELARRLAPRRKLARGLLRRVQDAPAQTSLDRQARVRNMRQAYAVDPSWAATIQGRRLLLIDDVMTTGATLHAAARTLQAAGAAAVSAVVLARTDLP